MRIVTLTQESKQNLLEDLLKRSPNNYGAYEDKVAAIVDDVRKRKTKPYLNIPRSSIMRRSMRPISK